MDSSEKWVLSGISIRSFLGVGSGGMELEFDRPVVVLSGKNGSGKSTIVSSIEWALFGQLETLPDYIIKGVGKNKTTYRSVVHRGEQSAEVALTFKKGDSTLTWTRKRSSNNPSPEDDHLDCVQDGESQHLDTDMIFGVTHDLYVRGVAPRQTAIRNLVHHEKADRNEALDNLFGIERYNKLSVGFSKGARELNQRVKKLCERFDDLQEQLDEQIESVDGKLAQRKRDAESSGGPPTIESLSASLCAIATTLGGQAPSGSLKLQALKTFREDLHEKAEKIWASQGPQAKLSSLKTIDSAVQPARSSWQELVKRSQAASRACDDIVNELGDKAALAQLVATAAGNVEAAEALLANTDRRASVLDKAQAWLEGHSHSPGFDCPVCRKEIERDELAAVIEESLQALRESGGEIEALQGQAKEARHEEATARDKLARYEKVAREAKVASQAASEAGADLLGRVAELDSEWKAQQQLAEEEEAVTLRLHEVAEMTPEDSAAKALGRALGNLGEAVTAALESALEEMTKVAEESKDVRERIVSAGQLVELLVEMEAKDRLSKAVRGSGVEASIKAVRNVGELAKCLADVAGSKSVSKAQEITESISEPLGRWFRRISCHPLLEGARIEAEKTKVGGYVRNHYKIRATEASGRNPVAAGPNLSGGYEMVLAVATLCAIQEKASLGHGLDLFILDEPIESLDPEHIEKMAKALAEHSSGKRTIITTSRPSFAQMVKEAAPERAEVFILADFEEGSGSSLEEPP